MHSGVIAGPAVGPDQGETSAPLLHATTQLMAGTQGGGEIYLPHEVEDLEKVVTVLQEQDPSDNNTWETRYILLQWLSIIFNAGVAGPDCNVFVNLKQYRQILLYRDTRET